MDSCSASPKPQVSQTPRIAQTRALVLEGGGVRGTAYLGALKRLDELLPGGLGQIDFAAGTSAGAITGMLVAARAGISDLERLVLETPFDRIAQSHWGLLRDLAGFLLRGGWNRLGFAREWLRSALVSLDIDPDIDFVGLRDATGVLFQCPAVDEEQGKAVVFGSPGYDHVPVVDGVLSSMAIPFFFRSLGGRYSDGGLVWNFPVGLAEAAGYRPEEVVALEVSSSAEIRGETSRAARWRWIPILGRTARLLIIASDEANRARSPGAYRDRVVTIETGDVSAVDFDLSDADKARLSTWGHRAVDHWAQEGGRP